MLFKLTMDPLQKILQLATKKKLLHPVAPRSMGLKASLYADGVALFIHPCSEDIATLKEILAAFGDARGLRTNLQKTEVFPIRVNDLDLKQILEGFPAQTKSFPCWYLGLPLHTRKLRKIDSVPLLNKVGGKLPGWNGKLMSKAARAQLVKSVLTSIVTYHATVFPLPKWLIKKIDKLRRNFL
jgi:hypothetical protein